MRRGEAIVRGGGVGARGEATQVARRSGRATPHAFLKVGYGDEEHPETMEAMEAAAEEFMLHGMVPAEGMQPKDGIQRVEVVEDGEGGGAQGGEGEEEMEVVQGGPDRSLQTWIEAMAMGCEERARVREPRYQRKEIPAVKMSQKFYFIGRNAGVLAAHSHLQSVKHDEISSRFSVETATFPSRAARQTSTRGSHDVGKDVYGTGERPRGWGWRPRPPEAQQGQLQVRLRPKLHALSQPCSRNHHTRVIWRSFPSTDTHPPNPASAIPLFPIRDRPVLLHTSLLDD